MAVNDIKNKQVSALPYDRNRKPLNGLVLPITDGSGNIIGWAAASTVLQPDGTLALKVDGGGGGGIDPVGLKNIGGTTIDPATEQKQDAGNTSLASILAQLDVVSSTRASEATLATIATEATLAAIKAQTDKLIFTGDDLKVVDSAGGGGAGGADRAETLAALGQMFTFASDQTNFSPAGTELPFILVRNPSGSGKQIRIRRVIQSIVSTNKPTTFRGYFNPTVTANGNAETVVNKKSDSAVVAVALVNTIPTISANGSRIAASVPVAGVFTLEQDFSVIVGIGDSLLITVEATVNNTELDVTIDWAEV